MSREQRENFMAVVFLASVIVWPIIGVWYVVSYEDVGFFEGMFTAFIGFVVTMAILGFAAWDGNN